MRTAPLCEVATIERRGIDPSSVPPETRYLGLEHIERGGRIIGSDTVGRAELASTKFVFTSEHVLYGKLRPNLGKVSRPTFSGVCSTDILPIRPGPLLDRDYLAHYLSQQSIVDFAASRTSGANLPRISPTVLGEFPIPLPSLDEQHRIAKILDKGYLLRATSRSRMVLFEALIDAVFEESFEGRRWPSAALGSETSIVDCPHSTPSWTESGEVCVRTSNLQRGSWDWSDKRYVSQADYVIRSQRGEARPGDIVMSREGTVGVAAIVEDDMKLCMGQRLVQVRTLERLMPQYTLRFLLKALDPKRIEHVLVGSTARHLNVKDLRALPIPVPPLDLQKDFEAKVERIMSLQRGAAQSTTQMNRLFASLQSSAFSGQL